MQGPSRTSTRRLLRAALTAGWALLATVLGGSIPFVPAHSDVQAAPSNAVIGPHVVVILLDDLDVASLNVMLRTPSDIPGRDVMMYHLKRNVIDRGFAFTQSFVTTSLCCPSRATFLTGRYAHNHGVVSNTGANGGVVAFRDGSTLATWLQGAGYRTGHVGKYLNKYGGWNEMLAEYSPTVAPPDPRYAQTYIPPGWDRWWGLIDPFSYQVYNTRINENGVVRQYGTAAADYQTDVLAGHARTFITESLVDHATQPFFLVVAPVPPHIDTSTVTDVTTYAGAWRWTAIPAPSHAGTLANVPLAYEGKPSFNEADISDKPYAAHPLLNDSDRAALSKQYRDRLESLRAVDDLIGNVASALGPAIDNTLFIVTSDNGFLYGEHRLSEKLAIYEESIRVPLYIRVPLSTLRAWGAAGYARRATGALALNTDLAPTIAELAGATTPLVDGRSLAPALKAAVAGTAPAGWRRRFLVEHWWQDNVYDLPTHMAIRTRKPDTIYAEYYATDTSGRTVWGSVVGREFYDFTADPYQVSSTPAHSSVPTLSFWVRQLRSCGAPGQKTCQTLEN
jgi:N-acetylglucosamine-6-sulfatase